MKIENQARHSQPMFLVCMGLSCFSHVQLFAMLWTVALQAPLSMGIPQARILKWVAMSTSRGSSWTQGSNPGLLHCRHILYHLSH